jgi:aerobic carbon-monoxide dehydrogenase medium subunit
MKSFEYYEPTSIAEAIQMLEKFGTAGRVLAGGTDLVAGFLRGEQPADHIVSVTSIDEMSFIHQNGDLHIGAATVFHYLDRSSVVRKKCLMLAEAAGVMGSRQIRNLATIGGNICNAVPSADSLAPLLAADAVVVTCSMKGGRRIPMTSFFKGPRQNVLEPDELVVELDLPSRPPFTGTVYKRFSPRRALDLAVVGIAVSLTLEPNTELIRDARVAMAAVTPVPVRVLEAEALLKGNPISAELLGEVAEIAVRLSTPRDSIRGSSDYKKEIIGVFVKRCLIEANHRAKDGVNGED